ncbi:GNAT family N-acetyltransferase [Enterococcus dongliensis]|uniref:GNAT family N-acetyltransferase n=1 Tax=Enterococcus dongliensis TaxID=2559925 RepID=UPI0028916CBD|nr:GNAT family N-acetyltransferase [Enterococcus dongliensis]MDT2639465.1 GNAT family N-acetyltransferase [Enterococcus dongliensis]MDT2703135.1 GNAT family N-acetyltransferase [Enterococcus dongliensis]
MVKLIEHLDSSDLETISQIWLMSNLDTHDFIEKEYWLNNYSFVKKAFSSATIYVYYSDNKIVGFLGIINEYIAGIFILQDYRSLGIGTQLLKTIQSTHTKLTLDVYQKNTLALKFYQKNGFHIQQEKLDIQTEEIEYFLEWHQ